MNEGDKESEYKVFCLKTKDVSKKSWKTYKGALKNCFTKTQMVSTPSGIDWMNRHPEYFEDRMSSAEDN